MCSVSQLCTCKTIWDRLKINPDERLKRFVKDISIDNEEDVSNKQKKETLMEEEDRKPASLPRMHPENEETSMSHQHVNQSFLPEKEQGDESDEVIETSPKPNMKKSMTSQSLYILSDAFLEWENVAKLHCMKSNHNKEYRFMFPKLCLLLSFWRNIDSRR